MIYFLRRAQVLGLFLAMIFLGSRGVEAQQDPSSGLWIRWRISIDGFEGVAVSESLFYRDGLVIDRVVYQGRARYRRGRLTANDLAGLKSLLNTNRIGLVQAKGCKGPDPFPSEVTYNAQLTWIGKGVRQNDLSFGSTSTTGTGLCPQEVENLFLGILDLKPNYSDDVATWP